MVLIGVAVLVVILVIAIPTALLCCQGEDLPGLKIFPAMEVISFKADDPSSYSQYVDSLDNFLKPYTGNAENQFIHCSETVLPKGDQVCIFQESWLNYCKHGSKYGYGDGYPCVILMFQVDKDFKPDPYTKLDELPEDMPQGLKIHIREETIDEKMPKMVWLNCKGADNAEPYYGFPTFYFVNVDAPGYQPPFVAYRTDLNNKDNQEAKITCTLWDKNADLPTVKVTLRMEE